MCSINHYFMYFFLQRSFVVFSPHAILFLPVEVFFENLCKPPEGIIQDMTILDKCNKKIQSLFSSITGRSCLPVGDLISCSGCWVAMKYV